MNKASFLSRLVAWLVDQAVLFLLFFVLSAGLGLIIGLLASSESSILSFLAGLLGVALIFLVALLQFLYFGALWQHDGQSLGMKLMQIRVIRHQAEPLSFWRAALRGTLGYWISGVIFGLGYLWAVFDENQETWHDKIFDTWIVQA